MGLIRKETWWKHWVFLFGQIRSRDKNTSSYGRNTLNILFKRGKSYEYISCKFDTA